MKRLLALILSLLVCFSLLVSCNEEEESSSSSQESSSSSSNEEQSSSTESASSGKLSYDDRGVPVFSIPENAYVYYNVNEQEKSGISLSNKCYDTWVFNDYESYYDFVSQHAISAGGITEKELNEYFLVVVYRREDIRWTENYSYSNFEKRDGKYLLVLEYTVYTELSQTEDEIPFSFDIVLIPRNECEESPTGIIVSLKRHIHRWEGCG